MATLTIKLDAGVIEAIRTSNRVTISMDVSGRRGGGGPRDGGVQPRGGSLPARVLAWANERGKPFETPDVMENFKLSRAHASMVVSKLANGPYPIQRVRRGVYLHRGAGADGGDGEAGTAQPREGTLAARILEWAPTRGVLRDRRCREGV